MVVRLDLEDGQKSIADVEGARVLARTLGHAGSLGGEILQMDAGGLVRTVLRPHDREHSEFDQVRLAPQQRLDALVFVGFETMGFERLGVVHRDGDLNSLPRGDPLLGLAPVHAPDPSPVGGDEEEQEAVERRKFAAVFDGQKRPASRDSSSRRRP